VIGGHNPATAGRVSQDRTTDLLTDLVGDGGGIRRVLGEGWACEQEEEQ
jgi:hypothetical protein